MSIEPWVNSGQMDHAMFAAVNNSCIEIATSHGNPPPPCSAANGTLPQPASTYLRYASAHPGGVFTAFVEVSNVEPTASPARSIGASTSFTKRPNSSSTPYTVSASECSKVESFDKAA